MSSNLKLLRSPLGPGVRPLSALAALALLPTLAAPSSALAQSSQGVIRISGSSTVFPITAEAIRRFRQSSAGRDVRFELKETGTTAGFRAFCSGAVAISNASRPINSQELKACEARGIRFIELPIAFDALTVAVNPRNTWATEVSPAELGRLWNRRAQGRIKTWNQVNSAWPARPITLCGPDKDSGTFDYFNKAVSGQADNSRSDYTSSEDDNVLVKCVANNLQALGYFGYSYYAANRNRIRSLAVKGPKGAVRPSFETVQKERYLPFSRPLFLYINNEHLLKRPELQRFVTAFVRQGPEIVKAAGAIPLPETTYRLVETKLYRHVLGSSFAGDLPVGLTVGQALGRSFQQLKRPLPR